MLRVAWIALPALLAAACAPAGQERLREYNEDGVRLFQRGAYADARASFLAGLSLKPADPDLTYNVGQCYDRLGQTAKAQQYYEQCLQAAPTHVSCRHALTVLLWNNGQQGEAARRVEEWLQREPNRAAAYAEHAYLFRRAGDLSRAQSRLQQALALDPHDVRALTEMALVYEALNRPDRALVLYERALESEPRQPDVIQRVSLLKSQGAGRPRPD
jgi:Tfp pilus assembly protein PilF